MTHAKLAMKTKRYQLHLYLTQNLCELLRRKAKGWGLTPAQYVKFVLVQHLGGSALDMNTRKLSEKEVEKHF